MNDWLELLRCPKTGQELAQAGACYRSVAGTEYAIRFGIPDFRTLEWVYTDDAALTQELAQAADDLSYKELIRRHFELTSQERNADVERFNAYYESGERRARERWQELRDIYHLEPSGGTVLDIGCGSGGNLRFLATKFDRVIGLDVDLANLVLARKGVEEAGVSDRVLLIAANAEALPLRDACLDFVRAENVIEHLADQRAGVAEVHRTLAPAGYFFFDSPNRFTLLPEPHVKVWGVSWLPRAWADPYTRLLKGVGYQGKRLLSIFELRRILREEAPSALARIETPTFASNTFGRDSFIKGVLRRAYNVWLRRIPVISQLLFLVVPTYLVLAQKGEQPQPSASKQIT